MRRPAALAAVLLAALVSVPLSGSADAQDRTGWFVVSFPHRIHAADRAALDRAGARAVQYVPVNSYVAWMSGRQAGSVAGVPSVGSVRLLPAAAKLDPSVAGRSGSVLADAVVFGSRVPRVVSVLDTLGTPLAVRAASPGGSTRDVVFAAPAAALAGVAAMREVLYVGPASPGLFPEDEAADQILAANVNTSKQPVPGYEPWLAGLGLDGSGVRISITDTGIDSHHPDLAGRVVQRIDYTPNGEPADTYGHGTHVSGIVGGAASSLPVIGRVKDAGGFLYGLGVAPKVEFVDQNAIATTQSDFPPSYGLQVYSRDAVRAGSVAWNASWNTGEGANVGYVENARVLDVSVRDADWETPGAEPLTMVFSAGNSGSAARTITSPKEAKNIITVASSKNSRAGSIDSISTFSSRGPAKDGRILPNVAAPGETVISTRSSTGTQACNVPEADSFGLYAACSGTSMATPHVTGAVALITQWWRRANGGANPSPAMDKALLINTATDMGAADVPNGNEGWGRVNLAALFDPNASRIYLDQSLVLTDLGQSSTFGVTPADPSKPVKVTLVWTDAPGAAGASPALVNDLDLTVTAPDGITTYLGNKFSAGWSIPGGLADRKNNLENVFLQQPATGTYTVRVSAFNLPGDGVPFSGDTTDQDFALIISNAVAAA